MVAADAARDQRQQHPHAGRPLRGHDRLAVHWRLRTDPARTVDEWVVAAARALRRVGHAATAASRGIVARQRRAAHERARRGALPAALRAGARWSSGPGVRTGVPILYDNPKEVGADRIVNAVAAYERMPGASIVVDFGTATTFDVVTAKGEYAGGVIVPGIGISLDALVARTAKLPRVELAWPPKVVGRTTVHAIQSGVTYGYTALVDGLVERIRAENDAERARARHRRPRAAHRAALDHHRGRRRVPDPRRAPHHLRPQRRTRCQLRRSRSSATSPSSGRAARARPRVADALLFAAGAATPHRPGRRRLVGLRHRARGAATQEHDHRRAAPRRVEEARDQPDRHARLLGLPARHPQLSRPPRPARSSCSARPAAR